LIALSAVSPAPSAQFPQPGILQEPAASGHRYERGWLPVPVGGIVGCCISMKKILDDLAYAEIESLKRLYGECRIAQSAEFLTLWLYYPPVRIHAVYVLQKLLREQCLPRFRNLLWAM